MFGRACLWPLLVLRSGVSASAGGRDHVEVRGPRFLWLYVGGESQALLVELGQGGRGDGGNPRTIRACTRARGVSSRSSCNSALLWRASLTSNRSAKSLAASMRTVRSTACSSWFRIVSSSWNPSPTARRRITESFEVDVDGARAWDEEETRLEVLQVVDRERIEALAVHGQDPCREEAVVE